MANIEEFRASLIAKRDLAGRMAAQAVGARRMGEHEYHRGRQHAFEQARKLLDRVDLNPWNVGHLDPEPGDEVRADSWDPSMCDNPTHAHHPSRTRTNNE